MVTLTSERFVRFVSVRLQQISEGEPVIRGTCDSLRLGRLRNPPYPHTC